MGARGSRGRGTPGVGTPHTLRNTSGWGLSGTYAFENGPQPCAQAEPPPPKTGVLPTPFHRPLCWKGSRWGGVGRWIERREQEGRATGETDGEMGCMPLAPKPPPYLQLCHSSPLPVHLACDPGSKKPRWGQGAGWASLGLAGSSTCGSPGSVRSGGSRGGFRFYAKEVSQGCGEGGTWAGRRRQTGRSDWASQAPGQRVTYAPDPCGPRG